MTEYTTSSEAYREHMTARERTLYWVQSHSPSETQFYSPSMAPSDIPSPSSPPSEVESSHSTPPRMLLRYGDGRPDEAIPYYDDHSGLKGGNGSVFRSQTLPQNPSRSKSGSHRTHSSHRHDRYRERSPPRFPEDIRVFPSQSPEETPRRVFPSHSRSRSLPRDPYSHSRDSGLAPPLPHNPANVYAPHNLNIPTAPPPIIPLPNGPQVTFSQPQPPWHPYSGRDGHHPSQHHSQRQPPAIVYAPSQHSRGINYSPPAMYSYPPQQGPGGMIYSHSAPVPGRYPPLRATPYPSVIGPSSHHPDSVREERLRSLGRSDGRRRDRSATLPRAATPLMSSESFEEGESNDSGSTYYVLPHARQKVRVIVSCFVYMENSFWAYKFTIACSRVYLHFDVNYRQVTHISIQKALLQASSTSCREVLICRLVESIIRERWKAFA